MTPRFAAAAPAQQNTLLSGLRANDRRRMLARCEPVELAFEEVLYEKGDRIRHVHFPIGGFVSLISEVDIGSNLEVGLVGAEGMVGTSLLLGVKEASLRVLVQGAGSALRMDANQFSRELKRSPPLRERLNLYLYVLNVQVTQMAACARYHLVEARLARWLLMTRDRAQSNDFRMTQEFLAYMLGVRRAGITRAASGLQRRKLIRYIRGEMRILDARGLEKVSCECHEKAARLYARVMA